MTPVKAPPARLTNLWLLLALLLVFATGVGAVATGSPRGRWVVIAHGIAAMAVVLLVPWKTRVVRAGLRRARRTRWLSLVLAGLAVVALLAGLGHTTGVLRSVAGVRSMWWHVAAALALVPLVVWHVLARSARPRRTDLSRRTLLRTGLLGAAAAGLYAATTGAVAVTAAPGVRRRFTGSYPAGSFDPAAMPTTIWLDDVTPLVDRDTWRLTVVGAAGRRDLGLADLARHEVTLRATLDCTSGWYAEQDWTGVPVTRLVGDPGAARSLLVRSVTGYWVRLPVSDLDGLLLATGVGGAPLRAGHGAPARLVVPGRRGFWWVKWVTHLELQDTPWWWQPPFPIT